MIVFVWFFFILVYKCREIDCIWDRWKFAANVRNSNHRNTTFISSVCNVMMIRSNTFTESHRFKYFITTITTFDSIVAIMRSNFRWNKICELFQYWQLTNYINRIQYTQKFLFHKFLNVIQKKQIEIKKLHSDTILLLLLLLSMGKLKCQNHQQFIDKKTVINRYTWLLTFGPLNNAI